MNKFELIEKISHNTGITKKFAQITLNATLHSISQTLSKGGHIRIVGFGSFGLTNRKARIYRHPKTGELIEVPTKTRLRFKPSCRLISYVNNPVPAHTNRHSTERDNPAGLL